MTVNKPLKGKSSPPHKSPVDQNKFADGLDTPIQFCPGVGPKRAAMFDKLGIKTVRDLFWHFPRGYEDFHQITPMNRLRAGEVTTAFGCIESLSDRLPASRGRVRSIVDAQMRDKNGFLRLVWFNQPFMRDKLKIGEYILVHGKVELYNSFFQMNNPKYQLIGQDRMSSAVEGILSIYPLSDGLNQTILRNAMQKAFDRFGECLAEPFPDSWLSEFDYPKRIDAVRILHFPKPDEGAPTDIAVQRTQSLLEESGEGIEVEYLQASDPTKPWDKARRRMVFEEFFFHQLTLRRANFERKQLQGIAHALPDPSPWTGGSGRIDPRQRRFWPALFVRRLPFKLTADQIRVCKEIERDMADPRPMNRLLQGDVGSGKTVVSLYAMLVSVASGYQAALMVPTELLAQQHAASIRRLTQCVPGLNVILLSGSATPKERRDALDLINSEHAHLVVGTHALFQEMVQFYNLGLVVVDEQHKFGVHQRSRLIEKGSHPDLLAATATPIPRTLSLTLFGDMDVSVIKSLPPGRPPLITRWTTWEKERKVWEFVDQRIGAGEQAYVVCPIIEPSEVYPHLPSTDEAFEQLTKTFLPNRRVALLHGRHSADQKEELMAKLRAGEIDCVVATTVIEVGVDLPNATMMIVLGAERFGLAQLHQLRGRVGRGTLKSYCVLLTANQLSPIAEKRMRVMEHTRDGFKIAEEDLHLRGPGEHLGTRQSGHVRFKVGDPFRDFEVLHLANQKATDLLRDDFHLEHPDHRLIAAEWRRGYDPTVVRRPS